MRFYFARTAGEVKGHIKSKLQFGDLDGEQLTELISRAEPIIEQIFTRMRDVIGKTCSSEIFLHESCIYRAVRQELLRRGYRVAQCYDSFYTDKEVADLATIIEQCAQSYRRDWIAQTQGDSAACVNTDEEPHATHTVEELAEVFGQDHAPAQSKIDRTTILQSVSFAELVFLVK